MLLFNFKYKDEIYSCLTPFIKRLYASNNLSDSIITIPGFVFPNLKSFDDKSSSTCWRECFRKFRAGDLEVKFSS